MKPLAGVLVHDPSQTAGSNRHQVLEALRQLVALVQEAQKIRQVHILSAHKEGGRL